MGVLALLFLTASFLYVQFTLIKYTNGAITHFQQCFAISRPFLDTNQEKKMLAQFAQIKSREDYLILINQLYEIGQENNVSFPSFAIW
jgi:hypothetical protein